MRFFPWKAFDFISNSSRKLSGRLCEKKNGQTFGHLSHHLNVFLFYLLTFNYQNSAHKTENTFYFVKVFFYPSSKNSRGNHKSLSFVIRSVSLVIFS